MPGDNEAHKTAIAAAKRHLLALNEHIPTKDSDTYVLNSAVLLPILKELANSISAPNGISWDDNEATKDATEKAEGDRTFDEGKAVAFSLLEIHDSMRPLITKTVGVVYPREVQTLEEGFGMNDCFERGTPPPNSLPFQKIFVGLSKLDKDTPNGMEIATAGLQFMVNMACQIAVVNNAGKNEMEKQVAGQQLIMFLRGFLNAHVMYKVFSLYHNKDKKFAMLCMDLFLYCDAFTIGTIVGKGNLLGGQVLDNGKTFTQALIDIMKEHDDEGELLTKALTLFGQHYTESYGDIDHFTQAHGWEWMHSLMFHADKVQNHTVCMQSCLFLCVHMAKW